MGNKTNLEKRLYFFVPYNISEIQKGIQAGHAGLRYARKFGEKDPEVWDFIDNHETWIILNGGTTNGRTRPEVINLRETEDPYQGSLNNLYVKIIDWNVKNPNDHINCASFQEPDLNDALTAICFICDERVFNYEKYPDYLTYLRDIRNIVTFGEKRSLDELKEAFPKAYTAWTKSLGGLKNVFLRNLLKGKKLA